MTDNAKPCILHDNRFLDGTPTASDTATGYDVLNIRDLRPFTWWQGAAAGTEYITVASDLDVSGADLVANGGFANTTGLTPTDCTIASVAGGVAGNCLQVTRTGGTSQLVEQSVTLVAGALYRGEVYVKSGTSGNEAFTAYCNNGDAVYAGVTTGSWVKHTFYFTYDGSAGPKLRLKKNTATAGTMLFDSLTLYRMTGGEADSLAIIGHNLFTAGASVTVEWSYDNSSWYDALTGFGPTTDKAIFKKFTKLAACYWRLKIVTASVAARIAVCLLGVRMDFERFPAGNFDPAPEKVNGIAARSKAGHMIGATLQNVGIEIRADFKSLTPAWIEATFRPAWDAHLSQLLPFFFAWDTVNHPTEVYFVTIPEGFDLRMPFDPYRRSLSLTMEGVKET